MTEVIPPDAIQICYRNAIIYYTGDPETTPDVWTSNVGCTSPYGDCVTAFTSVENAKWYIDKLIDTHGYTFAQCEIIPIDAETICHRDMIVYYLGDITTTSDVWTKGNVPTYPDRVYPYNSVAKAKATIDVLKGYGYTHNQCVPEPEPDPCAGVICDDICIGADKYSQVCAKEGIDAGKCVLGELIEANSPECGYVPPNGDEPDDEPDNGEPDDDIPPVDNEHPSKSTSWLYIGAAIILFYLLTRIK